VARCAEAGVRRRRLGFGRDCVPRDTTQTRTRTRAVNQIHLYMHPKSSVRWTWRQSCSAGVVPPAPLTDAECSASTRPHVTTASQTRSKAGKHWELLASYPCRHLRACIRAVRGAIHLWTALATQTRGQHGSVSASAWRLSHRAQAFVLRPLIAADLRQSSASDDNAAVTAAGSAMHKRRHSCRSSSAGQPAAELMQRT
jgi:hypothetical protein